MISCVGRAAEGVVVVLCARSLNLISENLENLNQCYLASGAADSEEIHTYRQANPRQSPEVCPWILSASCAARRPRFTRAPKCWHQYRYCTVEIFPNFFWEDIELFPLIYYRYIIYCLFLNKMDKKTEYLHKNLMFGNTIFRCCHMEIWMPAIEDLCGQVS